MRLGSTRTLGDVQREIGLLNARKISFEQFHWEYNTPLTTSATAFTKYGAALFELHTREGDIVDLEYFLAASAGTAGALVKGRLVRAGVPLGNARQVASPTASTTGNVCIVHGRVRDEVEEGKQSYIFQWCQAGAASAYSAELEVFVTVYSG